MSEPEEGGDFGFDQPRAETPQLAGGTKLAQSLDSSVIPPCVESVSSSPADDIAAFPQVHPSGGGSSPSSTTKLSPYSFQSRRSPQDSQPPSMTVSPLPQSAAPPEIQGQTGSD